MIERPEIPGVQVPCHGYDWLDKIIEEQAAYYGLTVEQHAKLVNDLAQFDKDNPDL